MILILSSIAIVIEYAETMLFPAIPDIIKEFNSSYSSSSWILSGYLITAAVMAPIVGKFSDTYGKKKVLISIMSVFTASIALAGFSSNMATLIATRVVQGIGLSMFIIALSILQSSVPKEKYALANGILASTYFSGSSIGILIGGSIIHYFGWRTIFFSLIPVVITLLVVIIRVLNVRENEGLKQKAEKVEKARINSFSNNKANTNKATKKNDYIIDSSNTKNSFLKSLDIKGAVTLLL
jgi:MFS family permease